MTRTKSWLKLLVLLALLLGLVSETWADSIWVDGIQWTYGVSGREASIGGNTPTTTAVPTNTSGAIAIPSTLNGYTVTSIGLFAFCNCSRLTSVTIPDSVTSIGEWAFDGCTNLYDTHTLPGVCLVDGWAVDASNSLSGDLVLTGVRGIAIYAFLGCSGLASVTIPDSVTSIGVGAFHGCSGLTSVTIPDSVTSIGYSAFSGCSGIYDTNTLPGVCLVDGWAVDATNSLSGDLDLTGVRGIAGSAFNSCTNLTSVAIPNSVTGIGEGAFSGCRGLTSVAIPNSVTGIGEGAFSGCRGLTSVTIPDSVTSIGGYAFEDCTSLTSVTMPDSVTSIGEGAFQDCSGLTSVSIPTYACESTTISNVFPEAYRKISEMTILGSVTNIASAAFNGCTNLTMVGIQDLAAWSAVSFDSGENPLSYAHHLFHDGEEVTDLVIPEGVANIGTKAFQDCNALTSVTIAGSVTNIGACAFSNCYNIKGMVIPDSVESIGSCAFEDCKGLGSFSIGKGLETIGEGTATSYECHATFANAYTLTAFSVDPENQHFMTVNGVLYTKDGKELVAFPAGCRGEFAVPNGVEKIWLGAFCGAYDLKLLIIPDSVTEIGNGVFCGCSSLKDIYLPARFKGNERAYFSGSTSGHTFTYGRPVERTLELDGQGGIVETVTIHPTYCEAMPAISVPTREGYRFCGYFSEPDGGGVQYYTADGKSCRTWDSLSVTTLYAKWEEKPVVAVPVITPGDGTIFSGASCKVSIFCATAGAAIYYSTNGTTPRPTDAFRYTGPFTLTDSAVIKAVAVLDDVKSDYATASIRKMSLTLAEATGAPDLPFTTGGAAGWEPVGDATSPSGYAAQSGAIGAESETWMETTVSGAGIFGFMWKVDCERDDSGAATWDHLSVAVDGIETARIDGTPGWATMALTLEGAGTHTVRWTFVKDDYDEGTGFQDLAWITGVEWGSEAAPAVTTTGVPHSWLEESAADILAAHGGNYETAALAVATNGLAVWQCYVAGLSLTAAEAAFKVKTISFENGEPVVKWDPNLNEDRIYTVQGKAMMADDWGITNASSRFFRVLVEMPK